MGKSCSSLVLSHSLNTVFSHGLLTLSCHNAVSKNLNCSHTLFTETTALEYLIAADVKLGRHMSWL